MQMANAHLIKEISEVKKSKLELVNREKMLLDYVEDLEFELGECKKALTSLTEAKKSLDFVFPN